MNNWTRTRPRTRPSDPTTPPPQVALSARIGIDLNDEVAPVGIDLSDDDDVMISSPRSFAEAKNNARRNRTRAVVVDLDPEESHCSLNKRHKNNTVPRNQQVINLESRSSDSVAKPPSPPPPPPPQPVFNCPVCIGPIVEEVSTKCGHIFCRECIATAIAAQKKCPTCRRKISMKDTIRIFLPKASET